ncbi:MAG TPA: hypothetical protein VFN07_06805 [Trueperaceae bacterium]|nr:hypothetical protein [Trueperaceae bacterium]
MKKKFAFGCLIVAIAVLVVGGGAAYVYVIRPLTNTVKAGMELPKLAELDRQVSNKRAFSAPEGGLLQASDVERYLRVTGSVMTGLEGKASELEKKYAQLKDGNPGIRQVINAYADIIQLVVAAKEMQVKALNDANFSLDEYAWVRGAVLQATGHTPALVNLSALAAGEVEESTAASTTGVPEANVTLVAPYAERVGEYLPLALFGL